MEKSADFSPEGIADMEIESYSVEEAKHKLSFEVELDEVS